MGYLRSANTLGLSDLLEELLVGEEVNVEAYIEHLAQQAKND